MPVEDEVARHYGSGGLLDRIRAGLIAAGLDPDRPRPEDLGPVDEFHIGGIEATRDLAAQMGLGAGAQVLDLGSGLGGPARSIAAATGAHVTGIDLTDEFVAVANALSAMTGLADRTRFVQGSALDLPFAAASFEAATLIHVGMNLPDKPMLFAGVARVLKPGGTFAIYDVMRTGEGDLAYPVPWASSEATSFVETPAAYRAAAEAAGFRVVSERSRLPLASAHFAARQAALERADGPPPLGVHLVVTTATREKVDNMVANIGAGILAPVEIICRLPG